MILHNSLSRLPFTRSKSLYVLIARGKIILGGNIPQKIYGTLQCTSGKRLKMEHRIFFASIEEAITAGYRPCGNCMKAEYKKWKSVANA